MSVPVMTVYLSCVISVSVDLSFLFFGVLGTEHRIDKEISNLRIPSHDNILGNLLGQFSFRYLVLGYRYPCFRHDC